MRKEIWGRHTRLIGLCLLFLLGGESIAAPTAFARPQSENQPYRDACLISPDAALRRAKLGAQIVDVRRPTDFRAYHIPDSLNIPLYAVKANAFLKAEEVILVDSGPQLRELLPACRRLKAAGFKRIRVLRGGIPGWLQTGGKLDGMPPSANIGWLNPREILLEYDPRRWRVIHVTSPQVSGAGPLPDADAVSLEEMTKQVGTNRWRTKDKRFIAIIADEPADYRTLRTLFSEGQKNLYFVAGGTPAYQKERHRLQSIRGKHVFELQKPPSCSR